MRLVGLAYLHKSTTGDITISNENESDFYYKTLSGCLNNYILSGTFSNSLRYVGITPDLINKDPFDSQLQTTAIVCGFRKVRNTRYRSCSGHLKNDRYFPWVVQPG